VITEANAASALPQLSLAPPARRAFGGSQCLINSLLMLYSCRRGVDPTGRHYASSFPHE
jgi:hypothetical protein